MAQQQPKTEEPEAPRFSQQLADQPPAYPSAYPQIAAGYAMQQPIDGHTLKVNKGYPPNSTNYTTAEGQRYMEEQGESPSNNVTRVIMTQPVMIQVREVPYVNDYLALSIFSLFCCSVIGVIAIMKSIQARKRNLVGDYEGAVRSARTAKYIAIITILLGFIFVAVFTTLRVFMFSST